MIFRAVLVALPTCFSVIILGVLIFFICLYFKKKRKKNKHVKRKKYKYACIESQPTTEIIELSEHFKRNHIKTVRPKLELPPSGAEAQELLLSFDTKEDIHLKSKPVYLTNFEDYVMLSLEDDPMNNKLTTQFEDLKLHSEAKCNNTSLLLKNITKNRYRSLIPYDATRVILEDNESGDYINANYVDGYENPKAFIATQAPLPSTTNDFWWMIWQENVSIIVMLTQLTENDRVKCEQYWPELRSSVKFGKILIKNVCIKTFPDYLHRHLEVTLGSTTREIDHLQHTSWPVSGVPLNPQSFIPIVKKILARPQNSPTLVHCHAGCGRTGTFILCDIVLRMAAKEQKVDFLKVLTKMREQRTGLVSDAEQYIFAHFVVLECLFGKDFSIPIDKNFRREVMNVLRTISVKPILEYSDRVMMQLNKRRVELNNIIMQEELNKNPFSTIAPEHSHIFLPSSSSRTSFYLNAVSVDCYNHPKRFIVTQHPLSHTSDNYWRLITTYDINTIVSLHDQNCWTSDFNENSTTLSILDAADNDMYRVMKVQIANKHNNIKIINFKNWQREALRPGNVKDLIMVWKEMYISWNNNSPILITCYDGTTASGLFVALAYLLEKIKHEKICDVFTAIRSVRESREEFVCEWGQIEFLYKAAVTYVEEFDNLYNYNN